MNPHKLAIDECTNHLTDGSCIGAQINEQGETTHCCGRVRCRLKDGLPCRYFEELVLRMLENTNDKRKENELLEAKEQYEEMKHEHEYGLDADSMERGGDDETLGMLEETTSQADPGGWLTGGSARTRVIHLPDRRRDRLDRNEEIGSRISRNRC